jgi:hypothetical protein
MEFHSGASAAYDETTGRQRVRVTIAGKTYAIDVGGAGGPVLVKREDEVHAVVEGRLDRGRGAPAFDMLGVVAKAKLQDVASLLRDVDIV